MTSAKTLQQMKCASAGFIESSEKAVNSKSFGRHVASFQICCPTGDGNGRRSVGKQNDYWKLISYDIEPSSTNTVCGHHIGGGGLHGDANLHRVAGDKDLTRSSTDFLNKWFVLGQP
jgi:hypothetical protein